MGGDGVGLGLLLLRLFVRSHHHRLSARLFEWQGKRIAHAASVAGPLSMVVLTFLGCRTGAKAGHVVECYALLLRWGSLQPGNKLNFFFVVRVSR